MGNIILNALGKGVWYVLVAPALAIVDSFVKIFDFLIFKLFRLIIFHDLNNSISIDNIPQEFWYFVGFAAVLSLILFFGQIIKGYFHSGERLWTNFIMSSKMFIKAFGLIMLIPLILVGMMYLYEGGAWLISQIFLGNNYDNKISIASQIKNIASSMSNPPKWDDTNITDYPTNWILCKEWNPLISIVSAWATVFMFYKLTSTIMMKYFQVLGLAIAAPIPVVMQIRDEGEKLQVWKNKLIDNIFGVLGVYVGFFFFMMGMRTIKIVRDAMGNDSLELGTGASMIIQLGLLIALVMSISSISKWFGDLFVINDSDYNSRPSSVRKDVAQRMAVKSASTLKGATIGGTTGLATTGIFGAAAKHASRNSISKKWTNSKMGNRLNSYRDAKSKGLDSKSNKYAKKSDKLYTKAQNALDVGNIKKSNKIYMKSVKRANKFEKAGNKSDKLKQKVQTFKDKKKSFKD